MIALGENRYGKSRVRVMRVNRQGTRHAVHEWNVEVWLKGDFASCFEDGDNSRILPTDTMKNTVYALALESKAAGIEEFGTELVTYLMENNPQVSEAEASIAATPWRHIRVGERDYGTAFVRSGGGLATTAVTISRNDAPLVASGFRELAILKTANSGFADYIQDRFTTLKETDDRLLGTLAAGEWTYAAGGDYQLKRQRVMDALLKTFAEHESLSVQQTLFAMGKAALEAESTAKEIRLSMPNKHCNLVDLSAFGMENRSCIFVPTDEPHGSIEACVRRAD